MLFDTIRIRTVAAVIGASIAGFVLASTSAAAGPVAPFGLAPQVAQPMPADEPDTDATELPTRFKRQIVAYNGGEAAGTVIIDTPNTYLYLVLGGGRAMRYGIGVGREGFTWSGVQ